MAHGVQRIPLLLPPYFLLFNFKSCGHQSYSNKTSSCHFTYILSFQIIERKRLKSLCNEWQIWQMYDNLRFYPSFPNISRGWSPKFATELYFIIGIDQKTYNWQDCSFAKIMYSQGDHLVKRTSLLYFLNYAYNDI